MSFLSYRFKNAFPNHSHAGSGRENTAPDSGGWRLAFSIMVREKTLTARQQAFFQEYKQFTTFEPSYLDELQKGSISFNQAVKWNLRNIRLILKPNERQHLAKQVNNVQLVNTQGAQNTCWELDFCSADHGEKEFLTAYYRDEINELAGTLVHLNLAEDTVKKLFPCLKKITLTRCA